MPRRPRTVAEQATIDIRATMSPKVLSQEGQKDRKAKRSYGTNEKKRTKR